jgi:hypothetical protein
MALATVTSAVTTTLGAIAWDPEIRNILGVLVGVAFLLGSVWLVLSTNTGMRSGLLIVIAAASGWSFLLGGVWSIYGNVGLIGRPATWQVEEINYDDLTTAALHEARPLAALDEVPTAQELYEGLPEDQQLLVVPPPESTDEEPLTDDEIEEERDALVERLARGQVLEADPDIDEEIGLEETLGGWRLLSSSDSQRGDAVSTADEALGPDGAGIFAEPGEYVVLDAYDIGGKDRREGGSVLERIGSKINSSVQLSHPPHYAVVQVQAVVEVEEVPGEPPPPALADPEAQTISVVMQRDLGSNRLPSMAFTLVAGLFFALSCSALHRRDKVVAQHRAIPARA